MGKKQINHVYKIISFFKNIYMRINSDQEKKVLEICMLSLTDVIRNDSYFHCFTYLYFLSSPSWVLQGGKRGVTIGKRKVMFSTNLNLRGFLSSMKLRSSRHAAWGKCPASGVVATALWRLSSLHIHKWGTLLAFNWPCPTSCKKHHFQPDGDGIPAADNLDLKDSLMQLSRCPGFTDRKVEKTSNWGRAPHSGYGKSGLDLWSFELL